jgi:hypothetical protein
MAKCAYVVAHVPEGCTGLKPGEVVYTDCGEDGYCRDIVIEGGACDGAWLVSLTCECFD